MGRPPTRLELMIIKRTVIAVCAGAVVAASLAVGSPGASNRQEAAPKPAAQPGGVLHVPAWDPAISPANALTSTAALTKALAHVPLSTSAAKTVAAYVSRIFALTNVVRAKNGLPALTWSPCAAGFAAPWAAVLARNGALSHQSMTSILSTCNANTVGENAAYGNVTADQMMTMWMNSPGHRANILNPSYTGLGVGVVNTADGRVYGVQDLVGPS